MQDIAKIVINGTEFDGFEVFALQKSLRNVYNSCRLTSVIRQNVIGNKKVALTEVTTNDEVSIYINGILELTGYIQTLRDTQNANSFTFEMEIYDKTKRLESNGTPKTYKERNLQKLFERVLQDNDFNDIKVINNIGNVNIQTTEDIVLNSGETIINFLTKYAVKAQVVLITNKDGNLFLTVESETSSTGELMNLTDNNDKRTNILSSTRSLTDRPRTIVVYSESDVDDNTKNSILQKGSATDELMDNNMKLIVQGMLQSNTRNLNDMAKYLIARQRAETNKYTCSVAGWRIKKDNKTIWSVNQLVRLKDEIRRIDNEMLIESVEFMKDVNGGTITNLVLVNKGSYTTNIEKATQTINKSKQINSIFI